MIVYDMILIFLFAICVLLALCIALLTIWNVIKDILIWAIDRYEYRKFIKENKK